MAFLQFWSCCCLSFHWLSNKHETGCLVSSRSLWLFLWWLGWSEIIWEMFHGRISLNSVLLLLLVNFVSGFRLGLMHISLIECIKLHSSPSFSAACAATIVHRNHFFHLYHKASLLFVFLFSTSHLYQAPPFFSKSHPTARPQWETGGKGVCQLVLG